MFSSLRGNRECTFNLVLCTWQEVGAWCWSESKFFTSRSQSSGLAVTEIFVHVALFFFLHEQISFLLRIGNRTNNAPTAFSIYFFMSFWTSTVKEFYSKSPTFCNSSGFEIAHIFLPRPVNFFFLLSVASEIVFLFIICSSSPWSGSQMKRELSNVFDNPQNFRNCPGTRLHTAIWGFLGVLSVLRVFLFLNFFWGFSMANK